MIKNMNIHASNFHADENILSMYLKEINRIPLLTREEEDSAARKAAAGDRQARETLVNANLRFVVNVAKKYQGQGIPLLDLISEGNIGLLNAIERYDVNKGYHFISCGVVDTAIHSQGNLREIPCNTSAAQSGKRACAD